MTPPSKPAFPLLLAVILALACHTTASSTAPHAERAVNGTSTSDDQCGFQGNSDVYGLGIRLGVYIQWVATVITNNFLPDDVTNMRNANYAFLLSNFIGLIYVTCTKGSTLNSGQLYSVEAWIILSLCIFGSAVAKDSDCVKAVVKPHVDRLNVELSDMARRKRDIEDRIDRALNSLNVGERWQASSISPLHKRSPVRLLTDFMGIAIWSYGLWFVFRGMDTMAHTPCSQYAFFFTEVNLFHWFRTLLKVVCIMTTTYYGVLFVCLWSKIIDRDFNNSKLLIAQSIWSIGYGPFFIVSIELMVRWNHIEGLYELGNTGQLIPLIVALFGLAQVVLNLLEEASS